jgi:hypothetical protein
MKKGPQMFISLETSRTSGFLKWCDSHKPASNDDDAPGGGKPIAVRPPVLDQTMIVPPEQPYRPWQMPGVGTAF